MTIYPGLTFGTRVVVEEYARHNNGGVRWLCQCTSCGRKNVMHAGHIAAAVQGKERRRCRWCYLEQCRKVKTNDRFWKRQMWLDTWSYGLGLYNAGDVERMCSATLEDLETAFGELPPPDPWSLWVDPGYREGGIK